MVVLGGEENVLELNSGDGRTILWYIKGNWILKGEKLEVLSHSLCEKRREEKSLLLLTLFLFKIIVWKFLPPQISASHILWDLSCEVVINATKCCLDPIKVDSNLIFKIYFKLLKWYETEHTLRCIAIYQFSVLCIPNVNSRFQVTSFCFAYMPWNQVFHVISLYIFRQLSNVSLSLAVLKKQ